MKQEDYADQRYNNTLLNERPFQIIHGPHDKAGTVVDGYNANAFWQARLELLQFFLYIFNQRQGVFTITHDNNASHRLTLAIEVGDTAPEFRANLNGSHVFQKNRCAMLVDSQRDVVKIVCAFNVAQAPNHKFGFAHFHQLATHIIVAALNGRPDLLQRNVESHQLVGIHNYLVLFNKAADGRHLGHAGHAG